MQKLTYTKILIYISILIALLLLVTNAYAFQFTFKNETGDTTKYFLWHDAEPGNLEKLVLLSDGLLEIGKDVALDFPDLVRPGIYILIWLVKYEVGFGEPWLRFWIYENATSMEVRLVRGKFDPQNIIKTTKGTPL